MEHREEQQESVGYHGHDVRARGEVESHCGVVGPDSGVRGDDSEAERAGDSNVRPSFSVSGGKGRERESYGRNTATLRTPATGRYLTGPMRYALKSERLEPFEGNRGRT